VNITERKIRNMIKKTLLKEVTYSEPYSANIAYFVVNYIVCDKIRKDIDYLARDNGSYDTFHTVDFTKTVEELSRSDGDHWQVFSEIQEDDIKMAYHHNISDEVIDAFKKHQRYAINGFNYIKKLKERSGHRKGATKKMFDMWSGSLEISLEYQLEEGVHFRDAHYSQRTRNIHVSVVLPKMFFQQLEGGYAKINYKMYREILDKTKSTLVHELVHSSQSADSFQKEDLKQGETKLTQYFRRNFFRYSDINESDFPKLKSLYGNIKSMLMTRFKTDDDMQEVNSLYNTEHPDEFLQDQYDLARTLIQFLAPEEVDAYIRGYYSKHKTELTRLGFPKKSYVYPETFYSSVKKYLLENIERQFEYHVRRDLISVLAEDKDKKITSGNLYFEYKNEIVEGYSKAYDRVFGKT
tara:strand:- start:203 stop:1429 length:1227 start_codon:yes stop_codon:yes gene_type:complete